VRALLGPRVLALLGILAALAGAAGLLIALIQPAGRVRPVGDFGADVGVLFQGHYPSSVVSRSLTVAEDSGLGLARVAPLWELTEPRPPASGRHRYDWRYDDYIAHQLAEHGLRWVAVLGYAPAWASVAPGVLHAAPRPSGNFAAYAQAVARRYRGLIAAFEVWNEENTPFFWRPAPSAAAYARLYVAARSAIHRVDPGAPVLVGGLAGGHPRFLQDLLRQPELRGHLDGVAIHLYTATPALALAQVRRYRQSLRTHGFGTVPLYLTEYGWSSRRIESAALGAAVAPGAFAPPQVRPHLILQTARDVLSSGCGVRMAIFYAWLTQQASPADPYQWYGVAAPSGAATPATRAIGRGVGTLRRVPAVTVSSCSAPG
jgi:hypothetical protein